MSREEIIRMAREAGFQVASESWWVTESEALERFANLVAASEREECAEICDRIARRYGECPDVEPWAQGFKEGASVSAAKIRERGQE